MTWIPSFFYRVASSKSCVASAQAQKDAVTATLIESNQGPVVPQPLQEAIAATPTGRIQAHEVQPPALQEAIAATPTGSIQANEVQVIHTAGFTRRNCCHSHWEHSSQ